MLAFYKKSSFSLFLYSSSFWLWVFRRARSRAEAQLP